MELAFESATNKSLNPWDFGFVKKMMESIRFGFKFCASVTDWISGRAFDY